MKIGYLEVCRSVRRSGHQRSFKIEKESLADLTWEENGRRGRRKKDESTNHNHIL
jgi:hypothetical protein